MPSTYSSSLRIELVADNEQAGIWGQTTNRNFTQVFEESITGTAEVDVTAADVTLTAVNGASDQARRPFVRVIGTPVVARQVNVPDVNKNYLVQNTTGQNVTVKPSGQTGVVVLPGQSAFVRTRFGLSAQIIEFVSTNSGNLTVPGTLTVVGATTLSTLNVTTAATINALTVTGGLTVNAPLAFNNTISHTAGAAPQLVARSGSGTVPYYFDIGRLAQELILGVSAGPGTLTTGDVAGDATLRATGRLWLSIGGSGYVRMDSTVGIAANVRFSAFGAVAPMTTTGVQIGTTVAQPTIQMYNSGAPADSKLWDEYCSGAAKFFRLINDANTVGVNWMEVHRAGTAVSRVVVQGPTGVAIAPPAGYYLAVAGGGALVQHDNGVRITNSANTQGGWMQAIAGVGTRIGSDTGHVTINTGGVDRVTVTNTALVGVNRVPTSRMFEVQGGVTAGYTDSEAYRVQNDGGFVSWYNTAGTVRQGYIQQSTGGDTVFSRETAGNMVMAVGSGALFFNTVGATRMTVGAGGIVDITSGSGFLRVGGQPTRGELTFVLAINSSNTATGLHRTPDTTLVLLECLVAEAGYSVGELVEWPPTRNAVTGIYTLIYTSTSVGILIANTTVQIPSKPLSTPTNITPGNWRVRVRYLWL